MKWLKNIGLVWLTMVIVGCNITPSIKSENTINQADRLISKDLVNVLSQAQTLDAGQVVLALPVPDQFTAQFAKALLESFENEGYLLSVSGIENNDTRVVSYTINQAVGALGNVVYTYTLNVGDISVRRSYQPKSNGWVSPVSDMQIKGALASNFVINNDIFIQDEIENNASPRESLPPRKAPDPEYIPLQTAAVNSDDNTSAVSLPTIQQPAINAIRQKSIVAGVRSQRQSDRGEQFDFGSAIKENYLTLGESNYANILNAYSTVNEAILIFGNDSTVLGAENKAQVSLFADQFDATRDLFSVVGCSHGSTAISGGQKALALGRAQRIKEALMFAGIPKNKILDEGCWAHKQFDKSMPKRGVVVALKRKI